MGKKIKILVIFCALLSAACGRKGKEEPTRTVNETTTTKQTETDYSHGLARGSSQIYTTDEGETGEFPAQ